MQMSSIQQPASDMLASVDFPSRQGLPVIAHIATTFKAKAGSARRLYRLLRALRDHGYGLILIVGRDFEPAAEWDLEGIHVHQIRSLVKYINPADDLKAFLSLRELLRRLRPHAVHTHLAKAGILGRWAAHLNHTPFILHTIHGPTFPRTLPLFKRLPYLLLERMTGRITDFFVFVGDELRDEYIRSGVCRRNNSVVIRTGRPDEEIDAVLKTRKEALLALRRSILRNGDDVLVVNVGRVVPSKQQDHAIKVVREMRQKGVMAHLALVGEALLDQEKSHMKSLTELACRLEMDNHVTFTGHREDALKIMAASDAVLHTSLYEGLPNILVECALTAKPVVTYAVSGAAEVVGNGATGFILDQGDIPAAADRLCFLAKHPSLSGLMGKRARRFLSEEYRESTMIQSKLQFYERIFFPMIGKKADMNPKAFANAER
jgi:glycosyltransferase involved in cell wall biosynthesis